MVIIMVVTRDNGTMSYCTQRIYFHSFLLGQRQPVRMFSFSILKMMKEHEGCQNYKM